MSIFEKIVGPFERIDRTFEGWDCVRTPCERCKGRPNDNHGIHSAERHLAVRTELASGRRVALVLTIVTGNFPATVPLAAARGGLRPDYYPNASDLSLHVQMPRVRTEAGLALAVAYDISHACTWFGEHGRCYVDYTTALGARDIFEGKLVDEALWKRLEEKLADRVTRAGLEGP